MTDLCPDDAMLRLVTFMGEKEQAETTFYLDQLLRDHPADARLHFVAGSLLAGQQRYDAARASMERAITLAPDYAIARFQLGLLLLTLGEPTPAAAVLQPLQALGPDVSLALFADGLQHLIRGDHREAVACLVRGIERNSDNEPLNHDMRLLLQQLESGGADQNGAVTLSAAQLMLQQAAIKSTKH